MLTTSTILTITGVIGLAVAIVVVVNQTLGSRMDEIGKSLNKRIDGLEHSLNKRIDGVEDRLSDTNSRLDDGIGRLQQGLADRREKGASGCRGGGPGRRA